MLTKNGSDLVKVLNNNMRCFEIAHNSMWFNFTPMLNNNMRCFEIRTAVCCGLCGFGLNNNMRCFEILAMKIDLSNVFVKQ